MSVTNAILRIESSITKLTLFEILFSYADSLLSVYISSYDIPVTNDWLSFVESACPGAIQSSGWLSIIRYEISFINIHTDELLCWRWLKVPRFLKISRSCKTENVHVQTYVTIFYLLLFIAFTLVTYTFF